MKRLQFHYHMEIAFSEPVREHVYTLKCLPGSTDVQRITECVYRISPANVIQEGTDSFGNRMLYGTAKEEHSLFAVDVTGRAETAGASGTGFAVAHPEGNTIDHIGQHMPRTEHEDIAIYRYQTPLTRPDERIGKLLASCREQAERIPDGAVYDRVGVYTGMVHESIRYGKGITDISTTAAEALALGGGVCQDYAQILISLCREDRIPARYVVGMLTGEGESHAWAEIHDGARWIGFDPTNNIVAGESHIKISHGRDYRDCSINRGVFVGQAVQTQSILVEVTEEP